MSDSIRQTSISEITLKVIIIIIIKIVHKVQN